MGRISYCPLVGGRCNKPELEAKVQLDTFFLAEPFKPEQERRRRERAVKIALKETLKKEFRERSLRVADKEPRDPTIFCDICRLIQSSAYGIADISGLNPNVLLELGMMFSLGKPVFVLVKKSEEEDLKKKLPSDIVWKRVIPYEEFIDIEEELSKQIQSRPPVELEPPLAEEVKEVIAKIDPAFAKKIDARLQEIKKTQEKKLKDLEKLLKKARLGETVRRDKEIEIPPSLEKRISGLYRKIEQIEKLVGFPKDPESALMRGNWHLHRKEYNRALELYNLVLTNKPDSLEAWIHKGIVLGDLGRHEESIDCFDAAIEIKKDDLVAWYNKAHAFGGLGKYEDARRCYEEALRINPKDLDTLMNLSEVNLILGDSKKGIEMSKKALGLARGVQQKAGSWFLYISSYLLEGKVERAEEEIKGLTNYLRGLGKDFKIVEFNFSYIRPLIKERLKTKNKKKLILLMSLLRGKIGLEEFEKRIQIS